MSIRGMFHRLRQWPVHRLVRGVYQLSSKRAPILLVHPGSQSAHIPNFDFQIDTAPRARHRLFEGEELNKTESDGFRGRKGIALISYFDTVHAKDK